MAKRPHRIGVNGEVYDATLARIADHDEQGRPSVVRLYYPDQNIEVKEGDEFTIAYVPKEVIETDPRRVVPATASEMDALKVH
jgi:hypothetical protein